MRVCVLNAYYFRGESNLYDPFYLAYEHSRDLDEKAGDGTHVSRNRDGFSWNEDSLSKYHYEVRRKGVR